MQQTNRYFGTSRKTVHDEGCLWGARSPADSREQLDSLDEAVEKGFVFCRHCLNPRPVVRVQMTFTQRLRKESDARSRH